MGKRPVSLIASDFFSYLGRHLPQQCASDEFYFLPRSETAVRHLSSLDDLNAEKIHDHIRYIKDLLGEISPEKQEDSEEEIDHLLLKQSMESFIREFDDARVWQSDPTLYVKIPLFATDQVISQRDMVSDRIKENLLTIFKQIPTFLNLAIKNLCFSSEISIQIAVNMARDAFNFHRDDIRAFFVEKMGEDKELIAKNEEVLGVWKRYEMDLRGLSAGRSFATGEEGLNKIFAVSLSYPGSTNEILEIAQDDYRKTMEKLHALARKIDSSKTWKDIIYEKLPYISSNSEVMEIYEKEVQNLRSFFYSQDIINFPPGEEVTVLHTPTWLQSLRATASYRAPLTGNAKDHGIFYITPGEEDLGLISANSPYLTAHETYPGHHILDHIRIHHSNPIRRQIESPLFYEGWACYAEKLLDDLGYVRNPHRQLIGLKRQLGRNLRAILDVELQTGKITVDEGAKKIEKLGFSARRAGRQIRRFAITPGYQSCYSMGMHEIVRLSEKYSSRLGLKTFHNTLLSGGEIPFHLVEKRLKACLVYIYHS